MHIYNDLHIWIHLTEFLYKYERIYTYDLYTNVYVEINNQKLNHIYMYIHIYTCMHGLSTFIHVCLNGMYI